jgi:hypothetical protein
MIEEEFYDLGESLPDQVIFEKLQQTFEHHEDYRSHEITIRGTPERRTLNPFKFFSYVKEVFNGWDDVQIETSKIWDKIFTAVMNLN